MLSSSVSSSFLLFFLRRSLCFVLCVWLCSWLCGVMFIFFSLFAVVVAAFLWKGIFVGWTECAHTNFECDAIVISCLCGFDIYNIFYLYILMSVSVFYVGLAKVEQCFTTIQVKSPPVGLKHI